MNLYFLRHGVAVDRIGVQRDSDRPLTAKGKQRIWRATEAMSAMGLKFDFIFSSPFLRAKQTAGIVAEVFKPRKKFALLPALAANGNPKQLVEQLAGLKPAPKNILLVGHEPYLGKLISLLATGNAKETVELRKGGLCKLEVKSLRYGRCAKLVWLLTPRQLTLME